VLELGNRAVLGERALVAGGRLARVERDRRDLALRDADLDSPADQYGFSILPGSPIDGAASDDDPRPERRYVVQRKPTASGPGASGLAGSSPVGSSSL
jgi:hypothetical protein